MPGEDDDSFSCVGIVGLVPQVLPTTFRGSMLTYKQGMAGL